MLRAIRSRVESSEMWFIAGGALIVVTFIAGGFGLKGTPALILGAASAALMLVGMVLVEIVVFSAPAK